MKIDQIKISLITFIGISMFAMNVKGQDTIQKKTEKIITEKRSIDKSDLRNRLFIGFKVGGNYSDVYDTYGENFIAKGKAGVVGGAFLSVPITTYVGLQVEGLFSQRGFSSTGTLFGDPYNLTRTSNYIDVPLFLTIKPARYFTFLVGPQYSYLVSEKNAFKNGTTTIAQEVAFDKDHSQQSTVCLVGGVDLNFWHVVVGARAGIDLQRNSTSNASATPRYKNSWVQLTVGYRIYQP